MNELDDYPFRAEVERRQQEPEDVINGSSLFANPQPSPLAIERLPERKTETLFDKGDK